jgi:tellurite resistance protein
MDNDLRINLLARLARSSTASGRLSESARPASILSLSAAAYGAKPSEDATVPTGFDPVAVALFESIVEGAFLVANADGVFDDEEKRTFERVVVAACGGMVAPSQITALVSDLGDQLQEDGVDRRVDVLSKALTKPEHALEVLRVAALLALSTDDVSPVEREVLGKIAKATGLGPGAVDQAIAEVRTALASAGA